MSQDPSRASAGKITLSAITRLNMSFAEELKIDKEGRIFSDAVAERFRNMHSEAERRRDSLLRSLAIFDGVVLLLLYGKNIMIPVVDLHLQDIPAALEFFTFLASLSFAFGAVAFFNQQAYSGVIFNLGLRKGSNGLIDPDFIAASEKFEEFILKAYRARLNFWSFDFFLPGRRYLIFFGMLSHSITAVLFLLLTIHLVIIYFAISTITDLMVEPVLSISMSAAAVFFNIVGLSIYISQNWPFSFYLRPSSSMPTGNLDGPAEKHSEQPGRAAIPQSVDGVYSIVASAVGGSALAVVVIHGGFIVGNDTSGSRYLGRLEPRDDGLVNVAITTLQPPGTFGIWGAAESDTLQQREFREVIPLAYFRNGEPFLLPSHGITLIVRRIPDGNAALAAKTGLRLMAAQLEETAQYWDRYDQEAEGKKDG